MAINGISNGVPSAPAESVSGSTSVASPTTASSSSLATVDYEMFLTLLMAQMENQDPLNPTDSTEYVAQLATFSQVEQSIQANQKLDQMLTSMQVAQSESLVGRNITSADGAVSGLIDAVKVAEDGLVATLDSGETVAIVEGVEIS